MQKKVRVFSTPSCAFCVVLKRYLDSKGIEYEDVDVSKDDKILKEMVELSGQISVPVVEIGKDVIIGFNRDQINKSLGIEEK